MGPEEVLLVLSGGMDSATLLGKLVEEGKFVHCVTFDYGQRHSKEIECAKELVKYYSGDSATHHIVQFPSFGGSALTDEGIAVPEGNYDEESMKATVVPNRNMIMLSLAAALAETLKYVEHIYYGAHSGDHAIYWDCRQDFLEDINIVLSGNDIKELQILAPFVGLDKGDIACMGKALKVPYQLTWTCYKGEEKACGVCGSCRERLEAFGKADMTDPLIYEEV